MSAARRDAVALVPAQLLDSRGLVAQLRSAWSQRDLAVRLALYDHHAENKGFVLGRLWHFLSPLLRIAVYGLVFGLLLAGRRPEGFIAFLAPGLFVYGLLQSVIQRAGTILSTRQGLLTSLRFSRVLLPASVVIRQLLEFRYEALVMAVAILATHRRITLGWIPFLLGVIPLGLVFALGVALLVAVAVARLSDVRKLLPIMFRLVFYASGVLFPIATLLDDRPVAALLPLNPFYVYVTLTRHLLIGPEADAAILWASGVGWSVVAILIGLSVFGRNERLLVRQ